MKKMISYWIPFCFIILTTSCATAPVSNPVDELFKSGEVTLLPYAEYADMVTGNSIVGSNGGTTYYRDDGVKLVKLPSGELVVREWSLDDSGNLCQTIVKTNKMDCLDGSTDMKVAIGGDTIYLLSKDKVWPFTLAEGNSANLSE